MDRQRIAHGAQFGVLVVYGFAAFMCIWALVLGVIMAIDSSVPGGLAVILAGTASLSIVAWRIQFKWSQLHEQ